SVLLGGQGEVRVGARSLPRSGDRAGRAATLRRTVARHVLEPVSPTSGARPLVAGVGGRRVKQMARAIYDERRWEDMPIVADALEEAGCGDTDLLGHCRCGKEHTRGCWAVDLLLGVT